MTIYSQLSGFKVLVTGANGFIGSRLCARLHEGGIEVHGVSRTKHPSGMLSQWWITDLSDLAAVREIITSIRPDMIFHLASHVSGIRSLELVLPTFTGNLCASVNLLIAATEAGCNKIVMAGSLEEPEMGNTHLVPCSPYAAAKWASSAYARMFHALYQTPVVIARPGMVYGQGQNDNSKLVPYVINSLINGNKPKLSKGDRLADWIHVDDVVDGLITMAKASNVEGKIIDIGSGELVSVRDVVRIIYTLMGATEEPIFGAIENRPMEQKRRADRSETLNLIGWEPVINLTQGLATTIEWYRARV